MQELEKILEEIEELRGQVGSECTSEDHYMKKAWEYCLDLIEEIIRKHMDDGWISVEERLPEDNESDFYDAVTVTLLNGDVTHGCYRNHDKEWWIASKDGRYVWSDQVIAWRPLPEPYRPGKGAITMTENEVLEIIKYTKEIIPKSNYAGIEALDIVISIIKEVQQYREIGTVEECREAREKQVKKFCNTVKLDLFWAEIICPECGKIFKVDPMKEVEQYCPDCGQAILWKNLEGMEDERN